MPKRSYPHRCGTKRISAGKTVYCNNMSKTFFSKNKDPTVKARSFEFKQSQTYQETAFLRSELGSHSS